MEDESRKFRDKFDTNTVGVHILHPPNDECDGNDVSKHTNYGNNRICIFLSDRGLCNCTIRDVKKRLLDGYSTGEGENDYPGYRGVVQRGHTGYKVGGCGGVSLDF